MTTLNSTTAMAQRIKNLPPPPPPPSTGADGIRVMYDEDLSSRLHFREEIGFGNWGSVWLCMPYAPANSGHPSEPMSNVKVATKLVHRSKTATTKARVQSLWNEWKIVTSLGHSPHQSIIDFYSFVVSDSYALITMAYHPRLVSVEVPEQYAKEWFRSLLSGVEYLHSRGVAHNDIKPANILLSQSNVPVLVDFGFAKQYDPHSPDAFHSNLSYGTPEYLSPERAAGHLHDSRKSDIWSLGVTFFEILVGRTPFEKVEGEVFNTKEQLHKYWTLTLRGKWVGQWSMSPAMEKLLRRMICPNADMRCTAAAAMADPYWTETTAADPGAEGRGHVRRKSSSRSQETPAMDPRCIFDGVPYRQPRQKEGTESALPSWSKANKEVLHAERREKPKEKEKDKDKRSRSRIPLSTDRAHDKENTRPPISSPKPQLVRAKSRSSAMLGISRLTSPRHGRSQSCSQSKENMQPPKAPSHLRQHSEIQVPSLLGLGMLSPTSPIKYIPPQTIRPAASTTSRNKDKENQVPRKSSSVLLRETSSGSLRRKPMGPRKPTPPGSPAMKRSVLGDLTRPNEESADTSMASHASGEVTQGSVVERMREWERERQRLREIERMEERRREEEAEAEAERRREEEFREDMDLRRDIERQRLLEIALDREKEREKEAERAREVEAVHREAEFERGRARELQAGYQPGFARMHARRGSTSTPPDTAPQTPLSPLIEEPESQFFSSEPRSPNESSMSILKQSLRMSIGGAKRLYKSSTQALGLASPAASISGEPAGHSRSRSVSFSTWEGEESSERASPLPGIGSAPQDEAVATANQLDRMTIWLRSVEKVVEDARQNFAASVSTPLPPLPVAPVARPTPKSPASSMSRSQHSSRVPRRILPANQIFANEYDISQADSSSGSPWDASTSTPHPKDAALQERRSVIDLSIPTIPDEQLSELVTSPPETMEAPKTPAHARTRRATIVTRSPEANRRKPSLEIAVEKHKEKSRSQHDLGRPITPVTRLEFELEQLSKPTPAPRLSVLVEKSMHLRDPVARRSSELFATMQAQADTTKDELTASPCHVEPYPTRPQSRFVQALDTPGRKHVEGVYDRFLMSTTGVKRVGLGYQSDNPMAQSQSKEKIATTKRSQHFFLSGKRQMPPPVSSEDLRRHTMSPDEFGMLPSTQATSVTKEENSHSVSIVRRAIKAITVKR